MKYPKEALLKTISQRIFQEGDYKGRMLHGGPWVTGKNMVKIQNKAWMVNYDPETGYKMLEVDPLSVGKNTMVERKCFPNDIYTGDLIEYEKGNKKATLVVVYNNTKGCFCLFKIEYSPVYDEYEISFFSTLDDFFYLGGNRKLVGNISENMDKIPSTLVDSATQISGPLSREEEETKLGGDLFGGAK